ncbi:hypothetical protein E4191_05690 [Paracoccus liaowanqingii]|uniref:Uncharacterized protein n=1 Tax=Paracoccus liaowanqingii TaxID=2560053 RepID=A0A4P7HKV9_9RHOB|nr:hypothetical protein [Paracoccus liaowanqingii]QBX34263.1 hypothetical protein E4191_05690 [Paracoccus liaowanqingii]
MKALGTSSSAMGFITLSIGGLGPAIEEVNKSEVSGGPIALWLFTGMGLGVVQQVILWNLKREKRDV